MILPGANQTEGNKDNEVSFWLRREIFLFFVTFRFESFPQDKAGGDPPLGRRHPPNRSEQIEDANLFLHRVAKLFVGVHHVLMRLLDVIELLLLVRRKQRPDLRQRAVHHRFHFLHRLLMNGGDLRFGRVDDRLDLGLLIRGQVQLFSDSLKAERVPVPATTARAMSGLRLHNGKAAEGNRAGGGKC